VNPQETAPPRRRPRGDVRAGLIAAGLELARTGGPDAVVLREATRAVGVVPNAAYRHFADRDELLAEVCAAAMHELADRMTTELATIRGRSADAAQRRLGAIGTAYLRFAREEPGLFSTAFALPQQHRYGERSPLALLQAALDELVDVGVLTPDRRKGLEYPIWSTVHGTAVLTTQGPLRILPAQDLQHLEAQTLTYIANSLSDARR
jgi:AcrR family transcriptional regulator